MRKPINVKEIEKVFFDAMLAGYANDNIKPKKSKTKPGYKFTEFRSNGLVVIDEWTKNKKTGISAGTTFIHSTNDELLWIMNYFGYYDKIYIPFLKEALLEQYKKREFRGGRGPKSYRKGGFEYVNVTNRSDFNFFRGKEVIYNDINDTSNFHLYQGILLYSEKEV